MGYSRSRARCVPLQYPSSATRGMKQVLKLNRQALNQNLTAVSTPLQEKKNISDEILNFLSKEPTGQVSQLESGMFYELSNKKGMECEKYQDCSWFQQDPIKADYNSKLSLAETIDSFTEANEFDLSTQYGNAQTSPWGDEYLEVFTDDILLEGNFTKLGEKNKNFNTNENFYNNKTGEGNLFDSCNFSLKKTDSVDSMKNISLTNPAEVIPISYKERLNNSNYGLTKLDEIKPEIKKEIDLYSPKSNSYVMDSDDSDLKIGREEVVEEMSLIEDQEISEKEAVNLVQTKPAVSLNKTSSQYKVNENMYNIKDCKIDNSGFKTEKAAVSQTICGKFDLNLDIAKLNFEQSVNVSTPDLDFMDLVDFINEEMRQENNNTTALNSTSNSSIKVANANQHLVSNDNQSNNKNAEISAETLEHSYTFPQNQSLEDNLVSTNLNNRSTINLTELSNTGVSIAERIKTSAKRKTRKSIKDLIQTEDEESSESLMDDDEDDDDYNYRDDVAKRKCAPLNKRIKSSYLESSVDDKRTKEENSNYRERRDKNNEASRRSRQNRKARERHMYESLEEEERRNVKLKAEADVLEKQVTSLRQLLLQVVLRKGGTT